MSESRSDLSLAAALRLMAPLVKLLLQQGVTYPRFADALKKTFVEAAQDVLEEDSARVISEAHLRAVGDFSLDGSGWSSAKAVRRL